MSLVGVNLDNGGRMSPAVGGASLNRDWLFGWVFIFALEAWEEEGKFKIPLSRMGIQWVIDTRNVQNIVFIKIYMPFSLIIHRCDLYFPFRSIDVLLRRRIQRSVLFLILIYPLHQKDIVGAFGRVITRLARHPDNRPGTSLAGSGIAIFVAT